MLSGGAPASARAAPEGKAREVQTAARTAFDIIDLGGRRRANGPLFVELEKIARCEGGDEAGVGELSSIELNASLLDKAPDIRVGAREIIDSAEGGCNQAYEVGPGFWNEGGPTGGAGVAAEAGFEGGAGLSGCGRSVVAFDDAGGELFFGLHGVQVRGGRFAEEEFGVAGHERVGDAHDFSKHFVGRLIESDVVPETFGHFFDPVEPFEDGEEKDDLRLHPSGFLQIAADEDIKELVAAAEFDIGADDD